MFIHFTTASDAASIVAEMVLRLSATIVGAVYAVAEGGIFVEGVQYGGGQGVNDDNGGREVAVVFVAADAPDTIFPEEAIWHRATDLRLVEAIIVPVEEAIMLLDGSANIPDDGIFTPALYRAA